MTSPPRRFSGGRRLAANIANVFLRGIWLILPLLAGCASVVPPESPAISSGRRVAVSWAELPGWANDDHAAAVPVFVRSCQKLDADWQDACAAARALPADVAADVARRFFERYFVPHQLIAAGGSDEGLITGYYEPLLKGALSPSVRFQYPIYARPDDLLVVDLGGLYPQLKNRRLRGRLAGGKVIPYYSRAQIDGGGRPLAGGELLWVDDKTALFFLHIQGSGLVQLPDGSVVGVGYHDQNGHPYRAIGKTLAVRGELKLEDINLFSIRQWLAENPAQADALLNQNPSYVFFVRREQAGSGPVGSLGVPLTPERSLATDTAAVPPGAPVWIATVMPDDQRTPLQKLMMAQDTGGAIRGDIRADFFWGRGAHAETMAGLMKTRGRLFLLLPRR